MNIECSGNVQTSSTGAPVCVDGSGVPVAWVQTASFDVSQLDSATLGEAWGIGVVIVGSCWAIGKATGLVLSVVRR